MEYIIIILITVLIAFAIIKSTQKGFKLESNKLIIALGGKENLISYEVNKSRFIVKVKNTELVQKEEIQKMGAKGIVEIDNEFKIILGENAHLIKKYIDSIK